MITGLRPATLNYGLYVALEELTDDLNERAHSALERLHEVPTARIIGAQVTGEQDSGAEELGESAMRLTLVSLDVD